MAQHFEPFPEHVQQRIEAAKRNKPNYDGPSEAAAAAERKRQRLENLANGDLPDIPMVDLVGTSSVGLMPSASPNTPTHPTQHAAPYANPNAGVAAVNRNAPIGPQLAQALAAQGITEPQPGAPGLAAGAHQPSVQQIRKPPKPSAVAAAVSGTIPVEPPAFAGPVTDGEGISVALPSRFAFYDFPDLYVRSPRGRHLSKLSKAHDEGSLQILAEVIADLTYSSIGNTVSFIGVDGVARPVAPAFLLTIQDFYFLLFYIRQNFYTKSQYIHTTHCRNPVHLKAVEMNQLPLESLTIQEVVNKSTLKLTELEYAPEPTTIANGEWELGPCRVIDVLDVMENPKAADSEFEYAAQLASYMRHKSGVYVSIVDRIKVFDNLDVSDIETIKDYEKKISEYGVSETITVRCKECGASREAPLSLDAHAFLAFN